MALIAVLMINISVYFFFFLHFMDDTILFLHFMHDIFFKGGGGVGRPAVKSNVYR